MSGSFKTNKYTINSLIREISRVPSSVAGFQDLVGVLSPRAGANSVKIRVLNSYLNGRLNSLVAGKSGRNLGSTARARLLSALRSRKSGSTSSANR
jgi:hypothetical protein